MPVCSLLFSEAFCQWLKATLRLFLSSCLGTVSFLYLHSSVTTVFGLFNSVLISIEAVELILLLTHTSLVMLPVLVPDLKSYSRRFKDAVIVAKMPRKSQLTALTSSYSQQQLQVAFGKLRQRVEEVHPEDINGKEQKTFSA